MNRREVIKSLGMVSLHALFPSVLTGFLSGFTSAESSAKEWKFFDEKEVEIIREIIDILLPETATRSASEAGVHFFLDELFALCMSSDQQQLIKDGLVKVKEQWTDEADKTRLVKIYDTRGLGGQEHFAWFKAIKQYTLIGFFTSEEGITKATDYQKMPDGYVGEVEIDENTPSHAKTFLQYYI